MNIVHIRGENTAKPLRNAFALPASSLFADDPAETAKATLLKKKAVSKAPTGGHAVKSLGALSKRGQKLLMPARNGIGIEAASAGVKRTAMKKAAI